jgi:hypothetical protein
MADRALLRHFARHPGWVGQASISRWSVLYAFNKRKLRGILLVYTVVEEGLRRYSSRFAVRRQPLTRRAVPVEFRNVL